METRKRISNPKIKSIVRHTGYRFEDDPNYPCDVFITSGQYEVAQGFGAPRISNFWYWKRVLEDGSLAEEEEHGYGSFEESERNYEIETVTTIKVIP